MPTNNNEVTLYVRLDPHSAVLNVYADSQCTSEVHETTVIHLYSNAAGSPKNVPAPTIGVVFVNPADPNNVKCGQIEFQVAAVDACPFANSVAKPDASKFVLIHDERKDVPGANPASHKAVIRDGLAVNSTYKFAIHGAWDCSCGPRTFTLDPTVKILNRDELAW